MKHICYQFLYTCMMIFSSFCLSAQGGLFLDLGVNSATLDLDSPGTNLGRKTGYFVGLHYAEAYKSGFEFGSNVQYSAKGASGFVFRLPETYSYLDAMASIGFRPVNMITVFAGGSVGRLLSNDGLFIQRDLDMGLLGGIKFNFKKGYVKAQYNRGLINQIPSVASSAYNQHIQLGVGFLIDFKPTPKIADTIIVSTAPPAKDSLSTVAKKVVKPEITDETRDYQVGLRLSGFDRFDMIYKVQAGASKYVRWSLFTTDINYTLADSDRYAFAFGLSAGNEYHQYLDEKTYFAHGPQFEFALSFRGGGFEDVVDIKPGFAYLVGVYHQANERMSIGLELMPRLTYSRQIVGSLSGQQSSFDLEFGTTNIGLVVAYRFNKLKKQD